MQFGTVHIASRGWAQGRCHQCSRHLPLRHDTHAAVGSVRHCPVVRSKSSAFVCAASFTEAAQSDEQPGSSSSPVNISSTYEYYKARRHRRYEEEYAKLSPEEQQRRTNIGNANTGKTPWNKGRKHSQETIDKIRAKTKEALMRPEVRQKVKDIRSQLDPEATARLTRASKEAQARQRAAMSEEEVEAARQRSSAAAKALWQDPEYRARVQAGLARWSAETAKAKEKREETPEEREVRLERRREQERARKARKLAALTEEEKAQIAADRLEAQRQRAQAAWADPEAAADRKAKISEAIRRKWQEPGYRESQQGRPGGGGRLTAVWGEEEVAALHASVARYPFGKYTWRDRHKHFSAALPHTSRSAKALSTKYNHLISSGATTAPEGYPSRASPGTEPAPRKRKPRPGAREVRAEREAKKEASKAALQQALQSVVAANGLVARVEAQLEQLRIEAEELLLNDPPAYQDAQRSMQETEAVLAQTRARVAALKASIPPYIKYNDKGVITEILPLSDPPDTSPGPAEGASTPLQPPPAPLTSNPFNSAPPSAPPQQPPAAAWRASHPTPLPFFPIPPPPHLHPPPSSPYPDPPLNGTYPRLPPPYPTHLPGPDPPLGAAGIHQQPPMQQGSAPVWVPHPGLNGTHPYPYPHMHPGTYVVANGYADPTQQTSNGLAGSNGYSNGAPPGPQGALAATSGGADAWSDNGKHDGDAWDLRGSVQQEAGEGQLGEQQRQQPQQQAEQHQEQSSKEE